MRIKHTIQVKRSKNYYLNNSELNKLMNLTHTEKEELIKLLESNMKNQEKEELEKATNFESSFNVNQENLTHKKQLAL